MKLSINIITYNREKKLRKALDSLIKQSFQDFEIVIVDNASIDNTQEMVELYKKENQDIKIIYEKQKENLGVAGGRNRTFEMSSGEYIYTFDDDAILEDKDFFEKAVKKLDNDKDIIIAATSIYEPASNRFLNVSFNNINGEKYAFTFKGGSNFIRRDFFLDKILYPNNLHFGAEENYASLQVWGEGKKVVFFDDLEMIHLPDNINRYEDRERILNGLINEFIIKKLKFPYIIYPILNVNFMLRLLKHKFFNIKDLLRLKTLYKERYNKQEKAQMSFKRWLELKKMFGVKRVS